MKRLIILIVLTLYITTVTECKQLLKLPVLLEHYTEHKALNGTISFLDFLQMHYIGDDKNDADQERDSQLPFMSFDDVATIGVQTAPVHNDFISLYLCKLVQENNIMYQHPDFSSSFLSAIWQPPKTA